MESDYNNENNRGLKPNDKANILCAISLFCVILAVILFLVSVIAVGAALPAVVSVIISMVAGLFIIAGVVLMIYARVRYPKSIFGKVVMWFYIVCTVVILVIFIAILVWLHVVCSSCMGLGEMG